MILEKESYQKTAQSSAKVFSIGYIDELILPDLQRKMLHHRHFQNLGFLVVVELIERLSV